MRRLAPWLLACLCLLTIGGRSQGDVRTQVEANQASDDGPENDGPAALVEPGTPCPGAKLVSSEDLSAGALEDVFRRRHAIIGKLPPRTATSAWTCGGTPVLVYGDVQLSFETGWDSVAIPAKWQALIDDYGGYTREVGDSLALVQPANGEETVAQVMVVEDGLLTRFLGTKPSPAEQALLDLADATYPST